MPKSTTTTRRTRTGRTAQPSAPRRRPASSRPARRTRRGASSWQGRQASRQGRKIAGDPDVQRFLERFCVALTSGDGRGAAACFEYPALMVMSGTGGYGGNQRLDDAEKVAAFFGQAPDQYHAKGIEQTFPEVESVDWVAPDMALVRARFPYIDPDGNDMGDGETSVYVIRKAEDRLAICAAVTLGIDSDRAS